MDKGSSSKPAKQTARKKVVIHDDSDNYDVEMLMKLEEMEQYMFFRAIVLCCVEDTSGLEWDNDQLQRDDIHSEKAGNEKSMERGSDEDKGNEESVLDSNMTSDVADERDVMVDTRKDNTSVEKGYDMPTAGTYNHDTEDGTASDLEGGNNR
ncbi:hypothetical protein PAHAL_7G077000 [Panicum hallii]|uniref:Uncharacterized protein n=1 Tax=Panicum hallii TaxID=206008 RepID=A0A2T8IB95_9POAL|nr:hypothetical protein PAHAL_7G077000 [Panicum hallii]